MYRCSPEEPATGELFSRGGSFLSLWLLARLREQKRNTPTAKKGGSCCCLRAAKDLPDSRALPCRLLHLMMFKEETFFLAHDHPPWASVRHVLDLLFRGSLKERKQGEATSPGRSLKTGTCLMREPGAPAKALGVRALKMGKRGKAKALTETPLVTGLLPPPSPCCRRLPNR
jgi:hypothetical protein